MFEPDSDKKLRFAKPSDLNMHQLLCQKDHRRQESSKRKRRWQVVFWALAIVIVFCWIDTTITPDHSVIGALMR